MVSSMSRFSQIPLTLDAVNTSSTRRSLSDPPAVRPLLYSRQEHSSPDRIPGRKWFDCAECHRETENHPLLQKSEMVFRPSLLCFMTPLLPTLTKETRPSPARSARKPSAKTPKNSRKATSTVHTVITTSY